ncbi:MAG: rhodanese family protein [Phycisphaerae bacterium]|nr:DUF2892 domain-containing protein [Phycisphaerae bacterium]MCZ2400011.1 rhodanese family protein [Phycisphaerae bacterium]NUQ49867.1 DUF2892 domain-containing protein [Phycisphaerae bacterium]
MSTSTQEATGVVDITPAMLSQWLADGQAVLIDVREDFEHAAEHIRGAQHSPLSKFDPESLRAAHAGRRVVFYCRSGKRAADAARRYSAAGNPAFCLAGGIEGWKAAGQATLRPAGAPRIDVMRQVQMTAGSLVLLGVVLGVWVWPWFLVLSALVGAGLVFAGASGWCGMAMLLAHMPWNRVPAACSNDLRPS